MLVTQKYFFLDSQNLRFFTKFKMCYSKKHCSTYCYEIILERTTRSTSGGSPGLAPTRQRSSPALDIVVSTRVFSSFLFLVDPGHSRGMTYIIYKALCSFVISRRTLVAYRL
jgi:hypothetical protein